MWVLILLQKAYVNRKISGAYEMIFRTIGPAVHTTPNGYQVCALLEINMGPPVTVKTLSWFVFDPNSNVTMTDGSKDAAIAEADAADLRDAPTS